MTKSDASRTAASRDASVDRSIGMRQLDAFCEVVRRGSFSGAARRLRLSQPTVSAHVAELERLFSVRLIDRLGREARPTAAGRVLFDYGVQILDLRARAAQAVRASVGALAGTLRIGASTVPAAYLLPARIKAFRDLHPQVRVDLVAADSRVILEKVLKGEVELGYVGSPPRRTDLASKPFAEDRLVLAVGPGHAWARRRSPVKPEDLAREPFVSREEGSGTRIAFERALQDLRPGLRLREVARLGSTAAVLEAVRRNLGVAVLSDLAVGRTLRVVPVQGLSIRRTFHEAWNRRTTLSPLALAFHRFTGREVGRT
ncbi:MAG: LysR family transcriptional regulator [Planctomycetes bacterium]|nr:LysR family transcriptional regulator [Planctomycetota bacterium]